MSTVPPAIPSQPSRRRPWLIPVAIVVAVGLACAGLLTAVAGWGFWLPLDLKERMANEALTQACGQIAGVRVTECSFTIPGSFLGATVVVELTTNTDEPRAAKDAVVAGQRAALSAIHSVTEPSATIYVIVVTPSGVKYDAQSVGFTSRNPSQSTLEERYR